MLRKVLAVALALAMCLGISAPAWAASETVTHHSVTITNVTSKSEMDEAEAAALWGMTYDIGDWVKKTDGGASLRIAENSRFTVYEATSPVKIETNKASGRWYLLSPSGNECYLEYSGLVGKPAQDVAIDAINVNVIDDIGSLGKGSNIILHTPGAYRIDISGSSSTFGYGSGETGDTKGFILIVNDGSNGSSMYENVQIPAPTSTLQPTPQPQTPAPALVEPTTQPQPAQTTQSTPEPVVISSGYIATTDVNVRASASANADAIGYIPRGTAVNVLDNTGKWYKVQFGNKTGYVSAAFVANQAAMNTANTTSKTVKTAALNVRSGAGTSHAVIGVLNNGNTVYVIEVVNGWAKIAWYGGEAYVSHSYLK